jgi:hypothetical protein
LPAMVTRMVIQAILLSGEACKKDRVSLLVAMGGSAKERIILNWKPLFLLTRASSFPSNPILKFKTQL